MLEGKRDAERNQANEVSNNSDRFKELNAMLSNESQPRSVFYTDASKLFSENKKKSTKEEEGGGERGDQGGYYITALNTKRNPDLLCPGGALKGNQYFRRTLNKEGEEAEKSDSEKPEVAVVPASDTNLEDEDACEDDMYAKLK